MGTPRRRAWLSWRPSCCVTASVTPWRGAESCQRRVHAGTGRGTDRSRRPDRSRALPAGAGCLDPDVHVGLAGAGGSQPTGASLTRPAQRRGVAAGPYPPPVHVCPPPAPALPPPPFPPPPPPLPPP